MKDAALRMYTRRMRRAISLTVGPAGLVFAAAAIAACTSLLGDYTQGSATDGGPGDDSATTAQDSSPPGEAAASGDASPGDAPQGDTGSTTGSDGATPPGEGGVDAEAGPPCVVDGGDALNCGACGHSCQGGACVANRCEPLSMAGAQTQPVSIVANDTKVFWRLANGALSSEPVSGATSGTQFYVSGNANTYCRGSGECANIALDSTTAYWPDFMPPTGPIVQSQTVGGNSAYSFGTASDSNEYYTYVVQDGATLFAADYYVSTQGGACPSGGVDHMSLQPRSNTSATWSLSGFCWIASMAVDQTNLYWADLGAPNGQAAPGIFMATKLGTSFTRIAAASTPVAVATYGGVVYWTDSGTGSVMAWTPSAGASTLATSTSPMDLAVDSSGVYWVDSAATILHAPLTGSMVTPTTLAMGQTGAGQIATNAASVFWVNAGTSAASYADGAVMKLAK